MENDSSDQEQIRTLYQCKTCNNFVDPTQLKKNNELEKLNIESLNLSINHGVFRSVYEHQKNSEEELQNEINNIKKENVELNEENEKLLIEYNNLRFKLQKIKFLIHKKRGTIIEDQENQVFKEQDNNLENYLFNYQILNIKKQRNDIHPYTVYPSFCPHSRYNFVTIYSCCNNAYPCKKCHNIKEFHYPEKNGNKYYCSQCFKITDTKRCETCKVDFIIKNKLKKLKKNK